MKHNVTKCLLGLTLWVVLLGEPPIHINAQTNDTVFPKSVNTESKRSTADIKDQEDIKQLLFQQAFRNQDTVTLLISRRAKPKVVRIVKRVPVFIPIIPQKENYTIKDTGKRTLETVIPNYKTNLQKADKFPVDDSTFEKPKHHRGFLYRLFHKKH